MAFCWRTRAIKASGDAKTLTVPVCDAITRVFSHSVHTRLPRRTSWDRIYNQKKRASSSKLVRFLEPRAGREINRAPAKVQSALLEAMQEHQVTIGDRTYPLPDPFVVMATQNPIEQEGTYPLPEAQVDRFMLMIKVGYPTREEERAVMDRMTGVVPALLSHAPRGPAARRAQGRARRVRR